MNKNTRNQCSKRNSEDEDSLKKQDRLILDKNISKIINKYKTFASNKNSRENNKNIVIESKKSTEEANLLKIKSQASSGRQNYLVYDSFTSCNNKSKNKKPQLEYEKSIGRSDKTTNCRPVTYYKPQFPKVVEKNYRLRGVGQNNISFWRQKTVEEYLWNKFISYLKKKHLYRPEGRQSFSSMIGSKERIKNYLKKSDLMLDDLNDQYIPHKTLIKLFQLQSRVNFYSIQDLKIYKPDPVTRSPCKILHVPRCRWKPYFLDESVHKSCSTQVSNDRNVTFTKQVDKKNKRTFKNCVTQVNSVQTCIPNIFHPKNTRRDKSSVINVKKNNIVIKNDLEQKENTIIKYVATIENKIETLLQSMNDFINEMRLQRIERDINKFTELERNIGHCDKPQISTEKSMDFNFESFRNGNYTQPPSNKVQTDHKIDNIDSSDIFVKTYQADFNKINEKSISIKFEIPTRDDCTEISNSFSRQIPNCIQIKLDTHIEKATAALNTDPVSLVALLKLSSEALRGFFSFDFHYYLSYLQFPRLQWGELRPCLCANSVNIQKITNRFFSTESYLSTLAPVGPYKCQYCDEIFDKVCSWELHEFSCARSLRRFLKTTNEK